MIMFPLFGLGDYKLIILQNNKQRENILFVHLCSTAVWRVTIDWVLKLKFQIYSAPFPRFNKWKTVMISVIHLNFHDIDGLQLVVSHSFIIGSHFTFEKIQNWDAKSLHNGLLLWNFTIVLMMMTNVDMLTVLINQLWPPDAILSWLEHICHPDHDAMRCLSLLDLKFVNQNLISSQWNIHLNPNTIRLTISS